MRTFARVAVATLLSLSVAAGVAGAATDPLVQYKLSVKPGQLAALANAGYDVTEGVQGNTITGNANVGYALAAWMVLIMLVTIGLYLIVRRRSERWSR